MADLNVTRFIIDGKTFVIPDASASQKGLMSSAGFSKLAGIASNAQVNVVEGVKVNGTALAIASKIVDILIATGTANGSIKVNNVDVAVKGLAALAYKANVSQSDLDSALNTLVSNASTNATTALSKIDTLNGTGVGSVKKAIDTAFNEFSTKVTDDGVVNSYKELIDWAAAHGGDAANMASAINSLEGLLAGIGGKDQPATVQAAITAAVNNMGIDNYYTKAQADAKFAALTDFNTVKTKVNGIATGANKTTYSYDATTQTLTLGGIVSA